MKLGIYTDAHLAEVKSLVNRYTNDSKYSDRLDSFIKSIHWMYDTFEENKVDMIINCGDLFDKPSLNANELSAVNESYNNEKFQEYHLVGNHETLDHSSSINSLNILSLSNNKEVITDCKIHIDQDSKTALMFLPYMKDTEYLNNFIYTTVEKLSDYKIIVFSHYYYLGIDYGPFKLEEGLDYEFLANHNIHIFNGHIHNVVDYNYYHQIGSLLGSSFNDIYTDGLPGVMILNTDDLSFTRLPNPHSHLFYKLSDIEDINDLNKKVNLIKSDNPKILRVSTELAKRDYIRDYINSEDFIKSNNIYLAEVVTSSRKSSISDNNQEGEVVQEDIQIIDSYSSAVNKLLDFISNIDESKLPQPKVKVKEFIAANLE